MNTENNYNNNVHQGQYCCQFNSLKHTERYLLVAFGVPTLFQFIFRSADYLRRQTTFSALFLVRRRYVFFYNVCGRVVPYGGYSVFLLITECNKPTNGGKSIEDDLTAENVFKYRRTEKDTITKIPI